MGGIMMNPVALPAPIIAPQDATNLFHVRQPSAFFIANAHNRTQAHAILTKQIAKGWRFVQPQLFINPNGLIKNDQINNSKTIPNLAINSWIIIEGKTFRIATPAEAAALAALPRQYYLPTEDIAFINEFKDMDASLYGAQIAPAAPLGPNDYINGIAPQQLPINHFSHSHARWAGACIRHVERLPRCADILKRLFDVIPTNTQIDVRLYGAQYRHYISYNRVTLNPAIITPNDLVDLNNALGTRIPRAALNANSTAANTIPLKKLFEVLQVYCSGIATLDANNVAHNHNVPWLVEINIFGVQTSFLLSSNNNQPQNQIMVSQREGATNRFTGNTYTYWIQAQQNANTVTAHAYAVLNSTVDALAAPAPNNLNNLIQFLACTQIVEAHCSTQPAPTAGAHDIHPSSRVPGAGKQARNILRQHHAAGAAGAHLPLAPAFNAAVQNPARFFQMAGNSGTGLTRTEVNNLNNNRGASVTEMSDDSDVEIQL
jgi:hypothetical protein